MKIVPLQVNSGPSEMKRIHARATTPRASPPNNPAAIVRMVFAGVEACGLGSVVVVTVRLVVVCLLNSKGLLQAMARASLITAARPANAISSQVDRTTRP